MDFLQVEHALCNVKQCLVVSELGAGILRTLEMLELQLKILLVEACLIYLEVRQTVSLISRFAYISVPLCLLKRDPRFVPARRNVPPREFSF